MSENLFQSLNRDPANEFFGAAVPADGYRWWYLDAMSDDGRYHLVVITFIGSVFSPYYAAARRRGPADPYRYCAMNAVLYGPRGKRWAMTERRSADLDHDAGHLAIGPSHVAWCDRALDISVDEIANPWPRRLRGEIRLQADWLNARSFLLDTRGRHEWWPVAPEARVDVRLSHPDLRFEGSGYLDSNAGNEPLEAGFRRWDWSRSADFSTHRDRAGLTYNVEQRDGTRRSLALGIDASGLIEMPAEPIQRLERSGWRVPRETRSLDAGLAVRTLEDTPFYARSILTSASGRTSMHESLCLDRFSSRWVQTLLPFRMPRALR
jgi:carotenoid 1,2-hydratase